VAASVSVERDRLDVRLTGADRFWALSGGIRLPLDRVRAARVAPRADAKRDCPNLRLPGSYWPGRLHAGSYGLGDKRQLWCVHRAQQVLVLELSGRPYARVVLELPDPQAAADRVNAALARPA
jgi:hypothetical protein